MNTTANTYDSKFNNPPSSDPLAEMDLEYKGNKFTFDRVDYGQDITNDEYLPDDYDWYSAIDTYEDRSQNQSWGSKAGHGVLKAVHGTVNNILQTPGYIGGALHGLATWDMDNFINNSWVNALEKEKEWFNNEAMPVYVKKAVKDGGIMKALTSVDFWATEGADGVAFMAAAMAPGFAVKGIGNAARAMRLASNVSKEAGTISKGLKGVEALTKLDKFAESINFASKADMFNVINATAINTLYESGVEARGVSKSIEDNIKRMEQQVLNGEISEKDLPEFNKKLEQIKKDKPSNVRATLFSNMALLLLPNMLMNKAVLGEAVHASGQLGRFAKDAAGKATLNASKQGSKYELKQLGKTFGQNLAAEGFMEEGGQMTIEKKFSGESDKGWAETYLDVISSTEGQKAIALGGILGTGMYSIGRYRPKFQKNNETGKWENTSNLKEEKKQNQRIVDSMNESLPILDNFGTGLYKKDEEGNIEIKDGKPVYDTQKVAELGDNLEFIQKAHEELNILRIAEANGDKTAGIEADELQRSLLNTTLSPFIRAGKDGMELLKNHLQHSSGIQEIVDNVNKSQVVPLSTDSVISKIMSEAEKQQKDLEFYEKYGEYKNELFKETEEAWYDIFSTNLKAKYINSKSHERAISERIEKEKSAINELQAVVVKEYGKFEGKLKKVDDINSKALETQRDIIKQLETRLKKAEKITKSALDFDQVSKGFNGLKKHFKQIQKDQEKEQEINDFVDKVQTVSNKQDLVDLKNTEDYKKLPEHIQSQLENSFQKRKSELNAQKVAKSQAANAKAEETQHVEAVDTNNYNEEIQSIYDNFKEGEFTTVTKEMADNNEGLVEGDTLEIIDKKIEDGKTSITLFDASLGEAHTLTQKDSKQSATKEIFEAEEPADFKTFEYNKENIQANKAENDKLDDALIESSNITKVMSTDATVITKNKYEDITEAEKLPHTRGDNNLIEWERNPIDKKGTPISFDINTDINTLDVKDPKKKETEKSIKLFNKYVAGEDLSKQDYLDMVNYLPIKMIIDSNENTFSYFERIPNKDEVSPESMQIYYNSTYPSKKFIVEHLRKGGKIEDLQSKVVSQAGGRLNLQEIIGGYAENSLLKLSQVNDTLDNIELFVMNELGELVGDSGKPVKHHGMEKHGSKWAGAVFMKTIKANGTTFYLKINKARVTEDQANIIYELYKARMSGMSFKQSLSDLPLSTRDKIKDVLKRELELLNSKQVAGKDFKSLTIGELENFLIYTGSTNPKSRLEMKDGVAYFGEKVFDKSNVEDIKDEFIDWVTKNKNQNVIFRAPKNGISDKLNLKNNIYKKYLVENKVLNTTVRIGVNTPMFIGFTNTYIGNINDISKNDTKKPIKTAEKSTKKPILPTINELQKVPTKTDVSKRTRRKGKGGNSFLNNTDNTTKTPIDKDTKDPNKKC